MLSRPIPQIPNLAGIANVFVLAALFTIAYSLLAVRTERPGGNSANRTVTGFLGLVSSDRPNFNESTVAAAGEELAHVGSSASGKTPATSGTTHYVVLAIPRQGDTVQQAADRLGRESLPAGWRAPSPTTYNLAPDATWRRKLFTPTYVRQFGGLWFVVDCWHNRIVHHPNLAAPLAEWRDLVGAVATSRYRAGEQSALPHSDMHIPHSLATDGKGLIAFESSNGGSDGTRHSLIAYRLPASESEAATNPPLEFVAEVPLCPGDTARRPHRVRFAKETNEFIVYMTSPSSIARVRVDPTTGKLESVGCHPLSEIGSTYARSIDIQPARVMFPSEEPASLRASGIDPDRDLTIVSVGPRRFTVYNTSTTSGAAPTFLRVIPTRHFKKPQMNDVTFIAGWWYITSTAPCGIYRARDLSNLYASESLTHHLGLCQDAPPGPTCRPTTPYFLTYDEAADRIIVPYIFGCSGVLTFRISPDAGSTPYDVTHLWGGPFAATDEEKLVLDKY
jgi:hypothetical protein